MKKALYNTLAGFIVYLLVIIGLMLWMGYKLDWQTDFMQTYFAIVLRHLPKLAFSLVAIFVITLLEQAFRRPRSTLPDVRS